jgi:energy-coupling factor transporter ATP-binding protein EcfA2
MFVDPINTASTIVSSYELSKKAIPLFSSIVRRIRNGKLNIVIFGAGGTGKSTLGKILAGEFGLKNILQPYQLSVMTEQLQLDSKIPSSILVVPGQAGFVNQWDEPLRKIANSQIDLIINVVSYWYHSFTISGYTSYLNHSDYQLGMTADNFVAVYSQNNRELEMKLLNKIAPSLSLAHEKKVVIITLVTKQDLWWLNRQGVSEYYQSGDYDRVIKNVQQKLGSNNFIHQYISLSLVTENFRAGDSEILIPVAEGYEQKIQVLNLYKLLEFIECTFDIQIGG